MNKYHIEYKVTLFIIEVLNKELETNRNRLTELIKDKKSSAGIYQKTLDFCEKIEYAIQQMKELK
jgi:hypothetical protein